MVKSLRGITHIYTYVALMLCTLTSFYSYSYKVKVFPVIGAAMFYLVIIFSKRFYEIRYKNIELIVVLWFLVLITVSSIFSTSDYYIRTVYGLIIVGSSFLFASYLMLALSSERLVKVFRLVIITHLAFYFLQVLVYILFDYYLDYVFWFSGESARYDGYQGYLRYTGLYVEPGSYAAFMAVLTSFYLMLLRVFNVDFEKSDFLVYCLSLASVTTSFSMAGFVYVLLLSLALPVRWLFVVAALSLYIVVPYMYARYDEVNIANILASHAHFYNYYLDLISSDVKNLIIGIGGFNSPTVNASFVYKDQGLLFNSLMHFGVLLFVIPTYLLIRSLIKNSLKVSLSIVIFFSILSLSKLDQIYFIVNILLFSLIFLFTRHPQTKAPCLKTN